MDGELAWELDRQVVLAQLQNVTLALRSSTRFGSKSRYFTTTQQPAEHPLLQGAIDLHSQLLFCAALVSCTTASSRAGRRADWEGSTDPGTLWTSTHSQPHLHALQATQQGGGEGMYEREVARSWRASMQQTVTEEELLAPFCAVCCSSEVNATIASVAISGLVAIFSRPCSFVSVKGVRLTLEAVALTRGRAGDSGAHEVLIARIIQAYTACIRHPAAAELAEESYVRVVSRTLVLALLPQTSPLLKRTAESAMNAIVTTLYTRAIALPPTAGASSGQAGAADGGSFSAPPRPLTALEGTAMMRYISSLISGAVTTLDSEGNTVAQFRSGGGSEGTSSSGSGRIGSSGSSANGTSSEGKSGGGAGGKATPIVVCDSGPAIQLEGLWLAQAALFTVSRHLSNGAVARLRSAVQNDLSRALLIAGVGTTHVVVLSQILRTIHIAVKCAAQHLVPQVLSFLRVLHLNPLATLTEELSRAESTPAGTGFFGSGGGNRFGSPQPQGGESSPLRPGSPISGSYLSSTQLVDMYERKEVLLESLAEFCSDPAFLSFCYAHFDLSWHHAPVLPLLCDVLVNNAHGPGDKDDADGEGSASGGRKGGSPAARGSPRAASETGGGGAPRSVRPVGRLQLVALDAAANMVSEIAFRAMAASTFHGGAPAGVTSFSFPGHSPPPSPSQGPEWGGMPPPRELVRDGVNHMIAQKRQLLQFASLFEESPQKKGIPFLLQHATRVDTVEEEASAARHGKTWLVVRNPAGGREIGHTLFRLSVLLDKRCLGDHIGDLGRERNPKPASGDVAAILPDGTTVTNPDDVSAIVAAMENEQQQQQRQLTGDSEGASEEGQDASSNVSAEVASSRPRSSGVVPANGTRIVPALQLWEASRESDHLIEGTVRFYEEQLKGFIEMFDFRGKPLLTAIREMVYRLCLPGESQKIDRIMEAFAKHWYAQNEGDRAVNPFHSDSGAFVLSFAIIMLNTVFHSKRLDRSMTLADFKGMNRGIDDGNNVPDAYLSAIYEDVQKHEVVMAEMMDRGFANDVTWDLEMNGVQERAFHGVDGTLHGMLSLLSEESAPSLEKAAAVPSARTGTALSTKDHIQLVLDPFIFNTIWKRCLLVFAGMVESAGAQVSRLSPRGATIKDAISHTKALIPTEVSTLLSGLRGIHMLSRAAHAFGLAGVADQCMLTLLPHVALELTDAQDVVDGLYRSLTKLLCAREVFALLRTTASSLADSWPSLSDFLVKLYLLGFFAVPGPSPDGGAAAPATGGAAHVLPPPLPDVLARNPGIVGGDAAITRRAAANEDSSSSSGGGWFSSFFGGGGGSNGGNGSSRGRENAAGTAADISAITSQPRVRECIPDMRRLLGVLAVMPLKARRLFLQAIAANHSGPQARAGQQLTTQEAFILSHEICFAAAVALASPPMSPSPPCLTATPSSLSLSVPHDALGDAHDDVMGVYVAHLQSTVSRTLEAVERQTHTRKGHGSGAATPDVAHTFWNAVGDRVTAGVLHVAEYALAVQYGKGSGGGRVAGGGAPAGLLESVWRELQVFLDMPHALFSRFAAFPVARFVENWTSGLADYAAEMALSDTALETQMMVPLVSRVVHLLDKGVDPAAIAALCRAAHGIASHKWYDVAQQTEAFADAMLTLGSVRGQQEDDIARGRRSPQGPHSSTSSGITSTTRGPLNTSPSAFAGDATGSTAAAAVQASPGEIVGLCCRNVLHTARACAASTVDDESASMEAWLQLWLFCLRRLAGLVLCAGSPRAGSESLLNLQRALQDTELASLPAGTVASIYNDVLFPLVELVCAPGSEVRAAGPPTPPPSASRPSRDATADGGTASAASDQPDGQREVGGGTAKSAPAGFLAALFATAPPLSEDQQQQQSDALAEPPRRTDLAPFVPAEVKCRVVNLLPKILLQYTSSLAEYPELLQDLWQRVLGTLYAVYTAFPSSAPATNPPQRERGTSPGRRDVEEELMSDEAAMMREAVEETVKNMVLVVDAMGTADGSLFQSVPYFSISTRNLIRPFPFAAPLLAFLDSLEGGEARQASSEA